LAFVLPFEVPLFRLGPLRLTSVELVLYAMLGAASLAIARRALHSFDAASQADRSGVVAGLLARAQSVARDFWGDATARAVFLWAVVILLSASCAPSDRGPALKFALRSTSGILAFFAARRLARDEQTRRLTFLALVTGALLSAVTAVIESSAPRTASIWEYFRESSFDAFGLQRASGVFEYPTIGAMYWEAALPLLVVAPLLGRSSGARADKRSAVLVGAGSALLIAAILASATRSGLAGSAVGCGVLAALGPSLGARVRRTALQVLAVLAALSAVALVLPRSSSLLGQRLRWWEDDRWFRVAYAVKEMPQVVRVGEPFQVTVGLRNGGTLVWPQYGLRSVRLAYHWQPLDRDETNSDYEGFRNYLPGDVPPGGEAQVVATVWSPRAAGRYLLQWDLVQEDVTWFSEYGNSMPAGNVVVEGPSDSVTELARAPSPAPSPSRLALWRAATALWRTHPLLGVGPDNYRRRYEAVLSPAPNGQPYTDTRLHANSLYFETLADLGLLGLLSLALLVLALWRLVREGAREGRGAEVGCGIAAGAFFVHGALDYFFEFTPLFGLFWVLLGLAASVAKTPLREPEGTRP
jgi:hypothetical protein